MCKTVLVREKESTGYVYTERDLAHTILAKPRSDGVGQQVGDKKELQSETEDYLTAGFPLAGRYVGGRSMFC